MRQSGLHAQINGGPPSAKRTAVDSEDFDLGESALFSRLMGSVRHDHYQNSDKRDKRIADKN